VTNLAKRDKALRRATEGTQEEDVILCNEPKSFLFSSARLSANRDLLTQVLLKIPINVRLTKLQYLLSRRQNTPWAWELFSKFGYSWRFFGLQNFAYVCLHPSSHSLELAICFRDIFLINKSLTLNDDPDPRAVHLNPLPFFFSLCVGQKS